jgi:DNA end-binding protein Ku
MAPRPNWKGYLKLGLVSCPIALYPATSDDKRVSFRRINKVTGNRLRTQLVDESARYASAPPQQADVVVPLRSDKSQLRIASTMPEIPVPRYEAGTCEHARSAGYQRDAEPEIVKGRGYEIGSGVFIPISDAELDATRVERSRTIEIEKVVPRAQIDLRYLHTPYLIVPQDDVGQLAFAVIREALRKEDVVALGSAVMSTRERPIILEAMGKGIRGTTLRYPYEIRNEAHYFDEIEDVQVTPEMLKVAEMLLTNIRGEFDPSEFLDRQEEAVVELLRNKQAEVAFKPSTSSPHNVANLMDAFKRSLAGMKGTAVRPTPRPSGAVKRAALKRPTNRNRKSG